MAVAGRVAIVPKGEWSEKTAYKRLDAVTYNNTLYFARKGVPAGTETSNMEYWSKSIEGDTVKVATQDRVGIVKPDGKTVTVDDDGTLHGSSQVDIATKENAGIVKPDSGLTIGKDGALSVSIDDTTLTMDQVNNVIKLADTLKDKLARSLTAANIVNNNTTTEPGSALDARQANPNIEGTMAASIQQINSNLGELYFTGISSMTIENINSWNKSDKFITLPPGTYICTYKANTGCKTTTYIDTSIDSAQQDFNLYEKSQTMPASCENNNGDTMYRSVTSTFILPMVRETTLHFWIFSNEKADITYEILAMKIK